MRTHRKKAVGAKSQSNLEAVAFTTADEYNLDYIERYLSTRGFRIITLDEELEDVICFESVNPDSSTGQLFIFQEGSVVFWNVDSEKRSEVLRAIRSYETKSYNKIIIDEGSETMDYRYDPESKTKLQKGVIILNSSATAKRPSHLDQYAFSNGIMLSVKLAAWEASLDIFSQGVQNLTEDMKSGRKLKLTRNQVFQKTGELFSLRHQINISSDLLDAPDFYWDREELESLFNKTCHVLSVHKRTKLINEKLNHCYEIMQLLSNHLNDEHHTRLEWMIIILIMVEVAFEFLHYFEALELI